MPMTTRPAGVTRYPINANAGTIDATAHTTAGLTRSAILPATAPSSMGTTNSSTTTLVNAETDPDFSNSACPNVIVKQPDARLNNMDPANSRKPGHRGINENITQ